MTTDDTTQMASELSGLLKAGAADPLALLAGDWHFHSCFLAPFSPTFEAARQQFLVDGGGPLSATVEQLRHQGLSASEAATTARRLMEAATGLCVAVVSGDHGVASIPQPFFGNVSAEWRQGAVQVLSEAYRAPFGAALSELERLGDAGWPYLVAGPAVRNGDLRGYWIELVHGTVAAVDLAGMRGDARLIDMGHWCAKAVDAIKPDDLDAEDHAALCRCRLVAGEAVAACASLAACAEAGGGETAIDLLDSLATMTAMRGGDPLVAAWLAEEGSILAQRFGCLYDVALARVRILAAAGTDAAALRPAVDALIAADRKLARQALTREPVWQVTAADPGELLDTAAAATLIGRSPAALAKRLEARTIPCHEQAGQVRLPRRALEAWQQVMTAYGLLDS
jgi:hypothetical protein